jgi:hypothetical protein
MNDYGGIPGLPGIDLAKYALYLAGWLAFGAIILFLESRHK